MSKTIKIIILAWGILVVSACQRQNKRIGYFPSVGIKALSVDYEGDTIMVLKKFYGNNNPEKIATFIKGYGGYYSDDFGQHCLMMSCIKELDTTYTIPNSLTRHYKVVIKKESDSLYSTSIYQTIINTYLQLRLFYNGSYVILSIQYRDKAIKYTPENAIKDEKDSGLDG